MNMNGVYIPDIDADIIPIRKVIPNTNWKTEANNSISKEKVSQLNFSLDDVKCIFIKDEIMSHKIIKKLQSIFNEKEFALIMPKLLITTQVFDDF